MRFSYLHSTGTASDGDEAIGKSVAGNTTKIHIAVEACGLPIDFEITGGEVHDCKIAPEFFTKVMTVKNCVILFEQNHQYP